MAESRLKEGKTTTEPHRAARITAPDRARLVHRTSETCGASSGASTCAAYKRHGDKSVQVRWLKGDKSVQGLELNWPATAKPAELLRSQALVKRTIYLAALGDGVCLAACCGPLDSLKTVCSCSCRSLSEAVIEPVARTRSPATIVSIWLRPNALETLLQSSSTARWVSTTTQCWALQGEHTRSYAAQLRA